jgi:hypothetical protein
VTVAHDLGTTDLLIDLQAGLKMPQGRRAILPPPLTALTDIPAGQLTWTNLGLGFIYGFVLVDENQITVGRAELDLAGVPSLGFFSGELALRVRAWKLG